MSTGKNPSSSMIRILGEVKFFMAFRKELSAREAESRLIRFMAVVWKG